MNIGLYFNISPESGGVYQYAITLAEALNMVKGHSVIVFDLFHSFPAQLAEKKNITVVYFSSDGSNRLKKINRFSHVFQEKIFHIFLKPGLLSFIPKIYALKQRELIDKIKLLHIDLMFFPVTTLETICCPCPYIVAIHDLQHKIQPRFKEVSENGENAIREFRYKHDMKYAYKILAESNVGKEDILSFYYVSPGKVHVLPYIPVRDVQLMSTSTSLGIQKKLRLPKKYIFYPANFWPHKNHLNLIKALSILNKSDNHVGLVLTGSKDISWSTYEEVMDTVEKYHLKKSVHFLGYVNDTELSVIYKYATALVMPTYFGPTNLPILEAWKIGIPVVTSNIRGCQEQAGDAALLINSDDPDDIAEKIDTLIKNASLRTKLINNGKIRLKSWTITDFSKRLGSIVDEFKKNRL